MRVESGVGIILVIGILISLILKTYVGVAIASVGIPLYLAYIAREQNILAKSRLFDRDFFLMIAIAVVVILVFNYIWDPRVGLIAMAVLVPILALYIDRLKARKKPKNA
ncbi:hypothetical protein E3E23_05860 [Thermococcus sp. CX2]|uniref:hypothetical protein n=1 Tax=Thermococcus sp. CX2 TaxID=163006 RepID=UPI00143C542E|nr:hypothetical protein [Thermococcus sp. CX2]NJE85346.1 hypothetical protein [Thermococcus sp. CX2]